MDIQRAAKLYQSVKRDASAAQKSLFEAISDADELVRIVASIQVAHESPGSLPDKATQEMLDLFLGEPFRLSHEPPIYAAYAEATTTEDDSCDLGQDLALALAKLPVGSADSAIPAIIALWKNDRQFYEAALAAIALTFAEGRKPIASQLSDVQREVLEALLGDMTIWDYCGDTEPMLAARGLPRSREGLQAFLR